MFKKEVAVKELIRELQELKTLVAEVKAETDKIAKEVTEISFRVDRLKVDKLVIEKLEVEGLEIKLGGNRTNE